MMTPEELQAASDLLDSFGPHISKVFPPQEERDWQAENPFTGEDAYMDAEADKIDAAYERHVQNEMRKEEA